MTAGPAERIYGRHAVLEALRQADLDQLKPVEALNLLAELKKQIS